MTALIKNNLLKLQELVQNQPETNFDLNKFRKEKDCGTCFCVAGLAASNPYFNDQGMEFDSQEDSFVMINDNYMGAYESKAFENRLFGKNAFNILFEPYDCGYKDNELNQHDDLSHKELALARINYQLAQYQGF